MLVSISLIRRLTEILLGTRERIAMQGVDGSDLGVEDRGGGSASRRTLDIPMERMSQIMPPKQRGRALARRLVITY